MNASPGNDLPLSDGSDVALLCRELSERGIQTGVSKSGHLLRLDLRETDAPVPAALLQRALSQKRLKEVYLRNLSCPVHGDLAAAIAGLERLQVLDVEGTDTRDADLETWRHLPLRILNVRHTKVTGETIARLRKAFLDTRIIA